MPFHFCPQCGTKLQPDYKFCPSCGEKLPFPVEESGSVETASSPIHEAAVSTVKTSPASAKKKAVTFLSSSTASPRPALRSTRKSLSLVTEVKSIVTDAAEAKSSECQSSSKKHFVTFKYDTAAQPTGGSPTARSVRGKAKRPRASEDLEKELIDSTAGKAGESAEGDVSLSPPITPTKSSSPSKGKGRAKKAKQSLAVEPQDEGEELTDTTGKKWKLVKLLSHSPTELIYEATQVLSRSNNKSADYILKLGSKDGKIFNEQNFLQRAAKPTMVEKWIKLNKLDFLGIPSCVGFGLHGDTYRFLIFPNMGQSLVSYMDENELLTDKTVLQLVYKILEVLQFIHSNEYVHANINAENIYIKSEQEFQVYLGGYCHAFRYCPSGKHVEYRQDSRTPHEGAIEFISLDSHRGAAPTRRSDLQSLGYCMLRWHTGTLPWTGVTDPEQVASRKQTYLEDVPALLSHCFGKKTVSSVFQRYLTAAMSLQYSEEPNYSELKAALEEALQ